MAKFFVVRYYGVSDCLERTVIGSFETVEQAREVRPDDRTGFTIQVGTEESGGPEEGYCLYRIERTIARRSRGLFSRFFDIDEIDEIDEIEDEWWEEPEDELVP